MSKKLKDRLRDSALYVTTLLSHNLSFNFFDISVCMTVPSFYSACTPAQTLALGGEGRNFDKKPSAEERVTGLAKISLAEAEPPKSRNLRRNNLRERHA